MRRFVMIALSTSLLIGLTAAGSLFAQDEKKDQDQAKAKTDAAPKPDDKGKDQDKAKADAAAAPKTEELPTIPPDVEEKLKAARKAVAEAIVAAQDAGLVDTSIDVPPVLDILVTGRALDAREVRKAVEKKDLQVGVSPEVFGAWFTGHGKDREFAITPQKSVRITQPSKGLKPLYDRRTEVLLPYIDEARKARGGSAPATPAPAETKATTTPTPAPAPAPVQPKAEEKKDEAKDQAKTKIEEHKDEPKKDEPKKAEEPKAQEKKDSEAKADAPAANDDKKDENKDKN